MKTINGKIKRVIYYNEENYFAILALDQNDENGENIIIKGNTFIVPKENLIIVANGNWINDKKYGKQFKADKIDIKPPEISSELEVYLSTILKGVGEKTAHKIVDRFGDDTLNIIENDIMRLVEISGISCQKARKIKESYLENIEFKDIAMFFLRYGVSHNTITKIYKEFGKDSVDIISKNPYILTNLFNIGFNRADEIALSMGIPKDSKKRIQASVFYILNQGIKDAQCYLKLDVLKNNAINFLNIDQNKIIDEIDYMLKEGLIINYNECIYLPYVLETEKYIANRLIKINNSKKNTFDADEIKEFIKKECNNIKLSEKQEEVLYSLDNNVLGVTGAAGSGKSLTCKFIIKFLLNRDFDIGVCSPTGKAADNLEKNSNYMASTIHRMLKWLPHENKFEYNENNKLPYDYLIIDESTMVDIFLLKSLLLAINYDTKIIFIGDNNQLPAILPGEILKSLIDSNCFKVIVLDVIFRQGEQSFIIENSQLVNNGKTPIFKDYSRDFYGIECEEPLKIIELVKRFCLNKINGGMEVKDFQLISPMRKGILGTNNLNLILQDVFNEENKNNYFKVGNTHFRLNDRIIQVKNDNGEGVFNGNTGYISRINHSDGVVHIRFDKNYDDEDCEKVYNKEKMSQIELGYCITIHKSQGSTIKNVVLLMHTSHYIMLNRKILYTAITRASDLCILIGQKKACHIAVKNTNYKPRNSNLVKFIIEENNNKVGDFNDNQ